MNAHRFKHSSHLNVIFIKLNFECRVIARSQAKYIMSTILFYSHKKEKAIPQRWKLLAEPTAFLVYHLGRIPRYLKMSKGKTLVRDSRLAELRRGARKIQGAFARM